MHLPAAANTRQLGTLQCEIVDLRDCNGKTNVGTPERHWCTNRKYRGP